MFSALTLKILIEKYGQIEKHLTIQYIAKKFYADNILSMHVLFILPVSSDLSKYKLVNKK